MTALKIKVKKAKMVRKIEGVKVTGFYGRVVSTGKKTFEEVAKESARNTTLHEAEATLAANLLLDGIRDRLKEGYIVDLGPLGTLYPSVTGPWKQDADELALTDMTPKATYQPSDEISQAIKGATLSWATEKDEKEGTETPAGGDDNGGEDNGGKFTHKIPRFREGSAQTPAGCEGFDPGGAARRSPAGCGRVERRKTEPERELPAPE